jgi:hypothetical protein
MADHQRIFSGFLGIDGLFAVTGGDSFACQEVKATQLSVDFPGFPAGSGSTLTTR